MNECQRLSMSALSLSEYITLVEIFARSFIRVFEDPTVDLVWDPH